MVSSRTLGLMLAVVCCVQISILVGRPVDPKMDMGKALNYLMSYGYLPSPDNRAGRLRTKKEIGEAIIKFQSMAGLDMTGELNEKTMEMIKLPRCGMSDFGRSSGTRRKRYAVQGSSWDKKDLTYMYSDKGPMKSISNKQVKEQMNRAFQEWQRHANLSFTETSDPNADILVRFQSGYHDDGYPFDGEGGTLAHGFYPITQTGLSGDVHFDDDENWTVAEDAGGTDFYWTALHEIGHSLGLDHSSYKEAVMYPFYMGFKKSLVLNDDDIRGIRYLYGLPKMIIKTAPPPTETNLLIPTKFRTESPCQKHFDAVFADSDRTTYFLSGAYFWTVDEDARRHGPYSISSKWNKIPAEGIDAAYQSRGMITFFKGKLCWVYNGTNYMKGPENISTVFAGMNSSVESIDAAFVWGANGKTYLFKGDQYWKYNEALNMVDMGYPVHISKSWFGVPSNLNSAMTWINGVTYFFKDNDFWLFNNNDFKVQDVEPLKTNMYWMKCTENEMNLNGNGVQKLSSIFSVVLSGLFILCYAIM